MQAKELRARLGTTKRLAFGTSDSTPMTRLAKTPVFAATGLSVPPLEEKTGKLKSFASLTIKAKKEWSQNVENGNPLLCVAGIQPPIIKILDVMEDKHTRDLVGHGGSINDLKISPACPEILASISEDERIYIWHLGAKYEKKPVAAIFHGAEKGHCLAFHDSGRYLISGWFGTSIQLWALPDLPNENTGTDNVKPSYVPHFKSNEIHANEVDSIAFYGDLVISKGCVGRRHLHLEDYRVQWLSSSSAVQQPQPITRTIYSVKTKTPPIFMEQPTQYLALASNVSWLSGLDSTISFG
ncbi:uncharacterized protein IWZ02DRAFT_437709 [Phyllosticta citriasiana]|uniref:uncharacterized protein n=1 Tax=Phyllosticta citriasiana TaxID=595635 RepID=UPI0030FD85C3